ncbi:MAG: FKBP-type peptidyl-prolyl cis-trans isomerase [Mucilaginibacter sp.]
MKQTIFTILLITAIGFISCRKAQVEPGIKEYDQSQIQSYITTNGITGMKRDTVGGDTSGIYYQVILPGTSTGYQYTDSISLVYTIRSFDGLYSSLDTTYNHVADFAGHITSRGFPAGLQLIVHDVLKRGGSMRVLIPSRLAYGIKGNGSGSSSLTNSRIAGNQCLDYYIHAINNQNAYDDLVLTNYFAANNITGYQKTPSGLYYKILTPSTGTTPITNNTTVTITYTVSLLNGHIFDQFNTADGSGTPFEIPNMIAGVREAMQNYAKTGSVISLYMPTRLAYGSTAVSSTPQYSCMKFDFAVVSTNP